MSVTAKHIPTRKCIACRSSKPKAELLRVVKYQGKLFIDDTAKAEGRGAYICKDTSCVKAAIKTRRLEKAFRMQVPAEILNALEELSLNMEV